MKNLITAVLAVMGEVENIDKKTDVGTGHHAYKGVSDKDVKIIVGKAMQKHGLVMFPIGIDPTVKVERWEEENSYNGQKSTRTKQAVFTEVKTKYLLMHSSGESIEISGYGHGADAMDKSAGKATTYALKNALLYTFLVPTGSIDDTDNTHSEDIQSPAAIKNQPTAKATPVGIAPSLPKVVNGAKSLDALNTIWNNNQALHEHPDFLKLVLLKRLDFTQSTEDITKIFDDGKPFHADVEFVSALTARKKVINASKDAKQSA